VDFGSGPFIGAEALSSGMLNRHQLRTRFCAELPGVYLPLNAEPSLAERTIAAWLWSGRRGVVAGLLRRRGWARNGSTSTQR